MSDFFGPKKILLIIDPQNDFSMEKPGVRFNNGPLGVPGSSEDYERIAALIESNIFNEIHISLDTHTEKHIGHKGFYANDNDVIPADLDNITVCRPWEANFNEAFKDTPKDTYVKNYAEMQGKIRGTDNTYCIWDTHCIEGTYGHRIVKEITDALSKQRKAPKTRIRYHIKGQNELTEMYSIFSAVVQPEEVAGYDTNFKKYNGLNKYNEEEPYDRADGVDSYEKAINSLNLETSMNKELLAKLFKSDNQIYVCGQAKTHCVKDSVLDMIKYTKETDNYANPGQIHLITNCTSKIDPSDDDIEETLSESGGKLVIAVPTGMKLVDKERDVVKGEIAIVDYKSGDDQSGGKRRTKKQKKLKKNKTNKNKKSRKNKKSKKSRKTKKNKKSKI